MIALHLEALAAIALSLSALMAVAWMVQQRTGNSGCVDTIWTFAVGLAYPVIALSADYPWRLASLLAPVFMYRILVYVTGIPPLEEQMLRSRGARDHDYQSRTSMFFPLPPQKGVVS